MQFMSRYLVNNRTVIIANDAGLVTEYRPVYQKQIQVYKGIDNVLQFKAINADQKSLDITSYTPKFVAFDENQSLIIEHDGTALSDGSSSANRGLFTVTITENDLLNVKDQYLSYQIYLVDNSTNVKTLTYTDTHFGADGIIHVQGDAFPGPKESYSISTFTKESVSLDIWNSEALDAQPGINGNEALHTAAIYSDNFTGDITIQGTLDNQVDGNETWADISTVSITSSDTLTPVNFNGVYSYLRIRTDANPANTISKVLVRN